MSDLSTSADSEPQSATWDNVDLSALEDRLNQLGGCAQSSDEPPLPQESWLDRFLADTSQSQLTSRICDVADDGSTIETVAHYTRTHFEAGQTRAVVHLSFQPDLVSIPTVESNLIDGTGRTRISGVTKFGVRIEMQLSEAPKESLTICVESICRATLRE